MNVQQLQAELRELKAQNNAMKQTIAKMSVLVPHLVAVTATAGQPPEVADMVRCHNAAVDELLLLALDDGKQKIVVYGHDREPCMAIDSATLEVHDEY